MRLLSLPLLLLIATPVFAQPKAELPRVLLVGDSIRMGYAPIVAKKLEGIAEVFSAKANAADTATTLKLIDAWLTESKPLIVHWNNGLHDLKFAKKTKTHQVPLTDYAANLKKLLETMRKSTPHVIFATTTPINDVQAIEIYRGAGEVPAEYTGSGAMCGVVVIWTKAAP